MSSEVRGRWETPSYFLYMLRVSSFQLVAPRATYLRCQGGGVSRCDNDAKS